MMWLESLMTVSGVLLLPPFVVYLLRAPYAIERCAHAVTRLELESTTQRIGVADHLVRAQAHYGTDGVLLFIENLKGQDTFSTQVVAHGKKNTQAVSEWRSTMFLLWAGDDEPREKVLARGQRAKLWLARISHEIPPEAHHVDLSEHLKANLFLYEVHLVSDTDTFRFYQWYGPEDGIHSHHFFILSLMAARGESVQKIAVRITVTNDHKAAGLIRNTAAPNPDRPWLEIAVGDTLDEVTP